MIRKLCIGLLLLGAAGSLAGCGLARWLTWVVAGGSDTETVEAQFDRLSGSTVAVVVHADHKIRYEYPYAQLELSSVVAEEMRNNIKKITVVDPRKIVRYQAQNVNWNEMQRTKLGKVFNADFVLFITLMEFTTREPGSMNLYRGRITAEVDLWETSQPERDATVWRESDLSVRFPEKDPVGSLSNNDGQLRYMTVKKFAQKLVRRFYEHEKKIKP